MEGTVYLVNIEAKDLKKAKDEFIKKYPGDEYGTVEFVVRGKDAEYVSDGDIIFMLRHYLDVDARKEICVSVEVNIEELLGMEAFWNAIEDYVEKREKERQRFNLMKKMLEAYKEAKK